MTIRNNSYVTLGSVIGINLFIMFALTYAGVYRFSDVFVNLNRFYMAVLMAAPMVIMMLFFMSKMFENKRLNILLYVLSGVIFIATFAAIQRQVLVGEKQFLRSMIPHHSIAIKTCEYADIQDKEIQELCGEIVQAQEEEINQMRNIMERMER